MSGGELVAQQLIGSLEEFLEDPQIGAGVEDSG